MGKADNFFDNFLRVRLRIEEDMAQAPEAGQDHGKRELQHDGADGAAKYDHGGRRLNNLGKLPAFQQQAGQNSSDGDQHSTPTAFVQVQVPLILIFRYLFRGCRLLGRVKVFSGASYRWDILQRLAKPAAILDNPVDDLFGGFKHNDLLARNQSDD